MSTAIYLRVSTNSQMVAAQRREVERYLAAHDIDNARWFVDEAVSGATMDRQDSRTSDV